MTESKGFSNETELLIAAHLFVVEPKRYRERLEGASKLEVQRPMYQQLRDAAVNALGAPNNEIALACSAMGELISAIGDLPKHRPTADGSGRMPYSND